jgi:hypothetical protein
MDLKISSWCCFGCILCGAVVCSSSSEEGRGGRGREGGRGERREQGMDGGRRGGEGGSRKGEGGERRMGERAESLCRYFTKGHSLFVQPVCKLEI